VPLAARVNGAPILLEAYQRELARYEAAQAALGNDLGGLGDYQARVLEDLVRRELVLQAAARAGVAIADADVQARYEGAVQAAGGQAAFDEWLAGAQYTADEFREALRVAITARALAEVVVDVPETVEQVHARHILLGTEEEAQTVLALAQGQTDFADLARRYSRDLSTRLNGGELGWFYRGALAAPEVEGAAFNLQPNEISGVVPSALGFHIVQTLERDPARALDPADLAARRQQAFDEWLAVERAGAAVELLIQ
jgi:parvulin-like peptidyl-prolyl isomerase